MNVYQEELGNFFKPYDGNDLKKHQTGRRFRQILQHIHTENWDLIEHIERIIDIVNEERDGLLVDVAQRFIPGEKGAKNPSCFYLRTLAEKMIDYGEGRCPKTRVVIYASRSTAMLIECLMKIHPTDHLSKAWRMARRLFELMIYDGKPTMTQEEYATLVNSLVKEFVAACVANADELSPYLCKLIAERKEKRAERAALEAIGEKVDASIRLGKETHKSIKRVEGRLRKIGKRERARHIKEICRDYWAAAQANKALKEQLNTKLTRRHAYDHYKDELNALGVTSFEMFESALDNLSKNASKAKIKELQDGKAARFTPAR